MAPKRAALFEAEGELAITREKLQKARETLEAVEAKLAALEAEYQASIDKQNQLQRDIEMCGANSQHPSQSAEGGERPSVYSLVFRQTCCDSLSVACCIRFHSSSVSPWGLWTGECNLVYIKIVIFTLEVAKRG